MNYAGIAIGAGRWRLYTASQTRWGLSERRYDAQAVCEWLRENAPAYLTVDTKRFEKAVDGLSGVPVTWEEKITATIATNLSGEGA